MRFLVAPNAFKGTLDATMAANEIAHAIQKEYPDSKVEIQPVADGGDGTCALLIDSLNLEKISCLTLDPLGRGIKGEFGFDSSQKTSYLDVSTASGIALLKESEKDPTITSTFGTGLLIKKAIDLGAKEIFLGLGGSATVDMGTGILAALGIEFLDEKGRAINPISPGFLSKIKHIQIPPNLPKIKFTLLCDVRNPFLGQNGAVRVFGPQKGILEKDLDYFEGVCNQVLDLFKAKKKRDWKDKEGFGAAGGIALGLDFFFPVSIEFGATYFFEMVKMEEKVSDADWIITGEGRYDSQSDQGKASFELLQLAKRKGKKIALITSGKDARMAGFDLVFELPDLDFSSKNVKEKALENFKRLLREELSKKLFD
ncbi:glycerate kinase [Algoriphagus boseongensis]|uniref:Glycerate kinase n=1 Tax=Algoriphagus boseongensis TaxID=1442587 RepID=A0A4R6T8W7_9BACT|nr:glycerate kinase [Algoriphagus boseongensis]TDQ19161.1 glycerate kinase [Algoriphagus boseongensis]